MHLDMSQRIQVDPVLAERVRYTTLRPFVLRMNDTGADAAALAGLAESTRAVEAAARRRGRTRQIGGGAGAGRMAAGARAAGPPVA